VTDWLTTDEAAAYLKVTRPSLLLWVKQNKIKAYALSGTRRRTWRLLREDLDAFLLSQSTLPSESQSVRSERRAV
jgi:excisionase family DNA binding protein